MIFAPLSRRLRLFPGVIDEWNILARNIFSFSRIFDDRYTIITQIYVLYTNTLLPSHFTLFNDASFRLTAIETYIYSSCTSTNRVAGCRLPFKIDRPLFPTNTFTKTQFTEWAEPDSSLRSSSTVQSRCCYCSREPPDGKEEEERVGSGRMVSGRWYVYVCIYLVPPRKVGLSLGVQTLASYALLLYIYPDSERARINFNRLPIFSQSLIPPRGYRERSP